ncbi:hypothetical protein [Thiorhodovibrio frisius]
MQALEHYRQVIGIPAKLIVCGMASNGFSIAAPNMAGCSIWLASMPPHRRSWQILHARHQEYRRQDVLERMMSDRI